MAEAPAPAASGVVENSRTQVERQYLGQIALAVGAPAKNTFQFPLGEGWYDMFLYFTIPLTVGATPVGGVAFADHVLELINNIQLEVSADGLIVNAPAKALFRRAQVEYGTQPDLDDGGLVAGVNTAATYTMKVMVPIPFAARGMLRPEDTILNTARYSYMSLTIGLGALNDVLSTVWSSGGGFTAGTMTCDVEIAKYQGPLPDKAKPKAVRKFTVEGSPVDITSQTIIPITRDPKRAVRRIFAYAANVGTVSRPWSGTGVNTILQKIECESDQKKHDQDRLASMVRAQNKAAYNIETWPAGLHIFEYSGDGSLWSSLSTGDKSKLNVLISLAAGAPAGAKLVSVCTDVVEQIKS